MPRSKPAFKPYHRQQRKLFLESEEAIPEHHIVRVVDAAVDSLNVEPLLAKYHLDGWASYHPVMMLKLIIYAYTQKIYSCRKIAKLACAISALNFRASVLEEQCGCFVIMFCSN